jgi:hypothetical protein
MNVFSTGPPQWYISSTRVVGSRVEAASNTSTVALRVVGGDEKGSLESETVKYGRKSHGTRILEWLPWQGPAAIVNGRPVPLVRENAPQQQTRNCLTVIKILS